MSENVKYEVIVLFTGYSKSTERGYLANSTCTLVKGPKNVIVDTLTAWDGEKLIKALKQHDLNCDSIDYVVCTHTHSDHIGCNYLFPKAIHIVGYTISHGDVYFKHNFEKNEEYKIDEYIRIIPTPGHTYQDVSVAVKTEDRGQIFITGDLFESKKDLEGYTENERVQNQCMELIMQNRKKIANAADWIIPGHGPMFKVGDLEVSEML